jgi:hypothetical protein
MVEVEVQEEMQPPVLEALEEALVVLWVLVLEVVVPQEQEQEV